MSILHSEGTLLGALVAAPEHREFVTMCCGEQENSVTFGEFISLARRQAALLRDHDVGEGDTVILILPQGIEVMTAFVGAMMLGAVPSILAYPNFKVEPNKYRVGLVGVTKNLRAKLILVDAAFPDNLFSYIDVGEAARVIRCGATATSRELPLVNVKPETVAFIQHSAGTTGLQKGVALSHAAVLRQLDHLSKAIDLAENDRIYSWLPLYHDMGLIACFMLPLVYHIPVVMQSPTEWVLEPGSMLRLVTQHRCTLAWCPNFAFQFLARRVHPDDREEFELSSLRAIINCSEPVRAPSVDEFISTYRERGLRANIAQSSYAMAENVFAVTQSDVTVSPKRVVVSVEELRNKHVAHPVAPGAGSIELISSGRLLPNNEVQVMSPNGNALPEGHVGEIIVKSDSLLSGYYNRPDLTQQVLVDGWYWTGDLGFLLDGELFVVGRKKDLIIVAGKNIHPQDVEEIVCVHPAIHDGRAVALGVTNPDLGTEDIVVAAEVTNESDLADAIRIERALREAIVNELGVAARAVYLKPPKWIVKSTAGKPARSTTREKLLAEHPELTRSQKEWETL